MSRNKESMNKTLSGIGDLIDVKVTRNGKIPQGSEGALSKWAVALIDSRQDVMRANGENLTKDRESLRAIEYIATSPGLKRALELGDEIAQMRRSVKTDAEKAAVAAKEDELCDILSVAYDRAADSGSKKQQSAYNAAETYIINATVIGVEGAQAIEDMSATSNDSLEGQESDDITQSRQELTPYEQMLQDKYLGVDYDAADAAVSSEIIPPQEQTDSVEDGSRTQTGRSITERIKRTLGETATFLKERAKSTKDNLVFAANVAMGSIARFRGIKEGDYANPAEYRLAKLKVTKEALGAAGVVAFGAVAVTELMKWYSMASPVARAAGYAAEGLEGSDLPQGDMSDFIGHDSVMGIDDNMSLGMLHEHPEYAMDTVGAADLERAAVPGVEVYGDVELLPYNVETDPYNADKSDVFNMSDGFTSDNIESSLLEWKSDVVKSPEMMAMLLDQYGDIDPTMLDDDLSNHAELFGGAQHQVVDIIDSMKDVHYTTIPAGTEYSSYYTFMDEDGNFQLGRSFGVSHDHDITFMVGTITDADGNEKQIMINTECGQICNLEPTIGGGDIPVISQTPPPEPSVPETPPQGPPGVFTPPETPNTPPEVFTPPADTPPGPEYPGETPPLTSESKDSAQNIDENPQLDQSIANGGEKHDSGEYIPPEKITEQPQAPDADPVTVVEQELSEELPNEGGESSGRI